MNALDIAVIAQYTGDGPNSNSRFREICRDLVATGAAVELITSTFVHSRKEQVELPAGEEPFVLTQIHEPGYRKNISFERLRSHRALASNLRSYLDSRRVPDVIYCAIPSLDLAEVAARYARRHGVRLIFDVQDLWPEAFEMVLKPERVARAALYPLRLKADNVYSASDSVVTVSDTYSERVRRVRLDSESVHTVYLGTKLADFDAHPVEPWPVSGVLHLAYIGTLGRSYDLPLIFDAVRELDRRGIDYRLHVMGDGPLASRWQEETRGLADRVVFYGRLPYPEMVSRLKASDIALNPIVPGSAGSIINKVCDYAAAGLPVINTQESPEYRGLLDSYGAGINCPADAGAVAEAMVRLHEDPSLRESMGRGSRRLAEEKGQVRASGVSALSIKQAV